MSGLTGRQLQLKDAIDEAAFRLSVGIDRASIVVWRLATYGGHANTVPSSVARAELNVALRLAETAGAWVRYDARGEAEAVNLAEWRATVPALSLFRALAVERDRWSSTPTGELRAGPIHARLGAGLQAGPASLCAQGVLVDESQGRIRAVDMPNYEDDWCVTCERRAAELLGG